MVTKEQLVGYVKESLRRGADKDWVKASLLSHGFSEEEIENAFNLTLQPHSTISVEGSTDFGNKKNVSNESGSRTFMITLTLIIAVVVLIIGTTTYLIFSEDLTKSEVVAKEGLKEFSSCENTSECESGLICTGSICTKESGSSGSSGSGGSSGSSGSGGSSGSSGSGGSSGGGTEPVKKVQLIDCEGNLDCFIEAAEGCKPSKVTHEFKVGFFGLFGEKRNYYYELKGPDSDKCNFYIKDIINNKDATCAISSSDLVEILKIWKDDSLQVGTFDLDVWKRSSCKGNYFS